MRISAFISIVVCLVTTINVARAEHLKEEDCRDSDMSNAAISACLSQQLKFLDAKLDAEIATIIKNLPKSGLWGDFDDAKSEKIFYARRAQAILNADKQWRKFSEAECNVTAGIYEGGSGQETEAIFCRIEKLKERLEYLKFHEPYQSFRRNNG